MEYLGVFSLKYYSKNNKNIEGYNEANGKMIA